MNKTNIKNFAVWAREKLIMDIKDRARLLGITDKGIAEALPQSTADLKFFDIGTREYAEVAGKEIRQREALVKAIRDKEQDSNKYKVAFDFIVEEVAYTWFNRLVAIRFMEVNNYLPSGIRVLSSENPNKLEPDFITSPFETDMDFTPYEQDKIVQFKDDNKLDELFKMLFIKQCNKLNEILPELFERTDDYSELLLSISFKDSEGIVYHLVHDIDEDDFNVEKSGQVEIIGWLYQYYISAKRDEIINIYKGTIKKDDIPAATQIFTTDWVVRYMVDNSLGRYWIERNPDSNLCEKLEYFVRPKDGHINYVDERVEPTDMTFFDPCMGSGHILVYAFDVLMDIYRERGYTDRDAAQSIVEHNLYGIDIDKRAYQLAYFSVIMKARFYNRRIFRNSIKNNLTYIDESNSIESFECDSLTDNPAMNKIGNYLIKTFKYGKEYGSLISVNKYDYVSFEEYLDHIESSSDRLDIFNAGWIHNVLPLIRQLTFQAKILSNTYVAVVTNPPYMNRFEGHLKDFIQTNYSAYKGDLFSAFMYRDFDFCKPAGYSAFMTPFVWMFIKTYENLRDYLIANKTIISLIQMEYSAFEEATVPICSFIFGNSKEMRKGCYIKLSSFKGGMDVQKSKVLTALADINDCDYVHEVYIDSFNIIPGHPIAYWVSPAVTDCFKNKKISDYCVGSVGIQTGDNNKFIRNWWEVDFNNISFDSKSFKNTYALSKWFPLNKGGAFRKWYGNDFEVINWHNDGEDIKLNSLKNKVHYQDYSNDLKFRPCISWSRITSGVPSFRSKPEGFLSDMAGFSLYVNENRLFEYIIAFLNSTVSAYFLQFLAPTMNIMINSVLNLPVVKKYNKEIENLVHNNLELSKMDWDSFELSWDYACDPLVSIYMNFESTHELVEKGHYEKSIESCYQIYKVLTEEHFQRMKLYEENINKIFIDMYGIDKDINFVIQDKDVSLTRIYDSKELIPNSMLGSKYAFTKNDIIKNFISYSVGCMFGRYTIPQYNHAFNNLDDFVDSDNCIPITDELYFRDDIVERFVDFLKAIFGKEYLEVNLSFVANALGNRGKTSRDVIRNYFLNDFIKDHIKKYQKRPIYWLFDSGKQNGFKALVYMHRWNADTVGNMRVEYLHKMQLIYEREIPRMQDMIDSSKDSREIAAAEKRKEKLQKQYKETKDYDAKVAHIALSRIDIDLDDGVKVNYEKVQTAQDGKHLQILTKI